MLENREKILEIVNISKEYKERGLFKKEIKKVLKDVSFSLRKGECLGIVGESGSGKSTLGRIITGIERPTGGKVWFCNEDMYGNGKSGKKHNRMSIVFQNYAASVNPYFTVADIIGEPLLIEGKMSKAEVQEKVRELLENVGLSKEFIGRYSHELSGGQLQRVCIARAVAVKPEFIMLDEAVSSLDVSTQVEVLDLLKKLKETYNLSYIFVSHDLLTVTYICDSVIFFKEGRIVEKVDDINNLSKIKEEYSRRLLSAVIEF